MQVLQRDTLSSLGLRRGGLGSAAASTPCLVRVLYSRFFESMLEYNFWLRQHAADAQPPMTLLDTSEVSLDESVQHVSEWIRDNLGCGPNAGR